MKRILWFLAIPFILAATLSCDKDDNDDNDSTVTFTATLSGAQEAPNPTPSTATGTATLIYDTNTKIFTLTVTHDIANPTAGHIHKGEMGVSGGVIFPFTAITSPITYTSAALDAAQEADLYANLYYVNIHTAAYPAGEIRGQLIKQ